MIARLGRDTNYLFAALAAIVIAGLSVHRSMLLVVLILACTVGANLPRKMADYIDLDRDILFANLITLIVVPFLAGKRLPLNRGATAPVSTGRDEAAI